MMLTVAIMALKKQGNMELAQDNDSESDVGERSPQNLPDLLINPGSLITVLV